MDAVLMFIRVTTLLNIADPYTNKSLTRTEWFNANRNGKVVTDEEGNSHEFDAESDSKAYALAQTRLRKLGYVIVEKTYRLPNPDETPALEKRYVETYQFSTKNGWTLKEAKTTTAKAPSEVQEAITQQVAAN